MKPTPLTSPPSLLTLTSLVVSKTYPFAWIEDRYKNIIPEPVQKSIIYHSFPKRESDVLVYASSEFNADRYGVESVVQIGFHVSGLVHEISSGAHKKSSRRRSCSDHELENNDESGTASAPFKVSATFDRGKITSVACNCENESSLIFWCDHVVALALFRIRSRDFVLRVPISETLLQLNRSQLQKLVQYLISDHTDVLPTAQRLADEILFMRTDDNYINRIHGAPDITCPHDPTDPHAWALNEPQIQSQVRVYVSTQQPGSPNVIATLIDKAYRMIRSQDSNATRIVQIITNELVKYVSRLPHHSSRPSVPPQIWHQITRIWNVFVLKPGITENETVQLRNELVRLAANENLPDNEDLSDTEGDVQMSGKRQKLGTSSIFSYTLKLLNKSVRAFDYECSVLYSRVCHGDEDVQYAVDILSRLRTASDRLIKLENAHVLFDVLRATNPKQAYEAAVIGLTCNARLVPTASVHEKHMRSVEKLISKIHPMGCTHVTILTKYASSLLANTPHQRSFPPIMFVTYAFNILNSNLGYRLALKYLCLSSYDYVHTHLESQQIALATTLLSSSKHDNAALEEISSTIIRVVKSNTNLFRLAQEVFKHATNEHLIEVAFNIALHVVKVTKYTAHRRRLDMVIWVVTCGVEIGVAKLFYLLRNWGEYFSTVEAVHTVASNILAWVGGGITGTGCGALPGTPAICSSSRASVVCSGKPSSAVVDKRVLEELASAARNVAIQCTQNDPQNCAMQTLKLCQTDRDAFEKGYNIVLESSSKSFIAPDEIFRIARYLECIGLSERAYRVAVIALQFVRIDYNQDTHALISEVHWTCTLSHHLSTPLPPPPPPLAPTTTPLSTRSRYHGSSSSRYSYTPVPHSYHVPLTPPSTEIDNLIPLLIKNIKCATVLTEILSRSITFLTSYENAYQKQPSSKKLKQRVYEKLSMLIEGTIDAYKTTINARLVHISPRHYSDFIEFLSKARENFLLGNNGSVRFVQMIEDIKQMKSLRGKKKLLYLLGDRFK